MADEAKQNKSNLFDKSFLVQSVSMKTSRLIFTLKNEKAGKMPFSSLHFKMNFKTQTRIRFEEKQMELLKNWQLVLKEILLYYHNVNRLRGG